MDEAQILLNEPLIDAAGILLTPASILSAIVILLGSALLAYIVRKLAARAQRHIGEERAPAIYIGGQIARYMIIVIGLAVAVSTLGVDLSALSIFAGALGIGIGFGLQDVVRNFVCGVILLFDDSVDVGDFIELEDNTSGTVTSIGPRATSLLTNDNIDVLVPNANLLNGKLTNWTRDRVTRRVRIPFGVAYGSDKDLVKKAAIEAAHSVPFTLPEDARHRTQVWLVGFGESALDFELVVWPSVAAVKRPGSMHAAYCWALDDALRKYNIEIPFPQRDLRLRGFFEHVGEDGLRAFHEAENGRAESQVGPSGAGRVTADDNDAAQDVQDGALEEQRRRGEA